MAQITFQIPDEKVAEFVEAFLTVRPAPEGMTTLEWIKAWGLSQYKSIYNQGRAKLVANSVVKDDDIVS